jgi:hypothetical protein
MLCQNIHDPIFELEISEWERAKGSFPSTRIEEFCHAIDEQDILRRRDLAGRILQRLKSDDCPPALGIYGGWGTGKTSLLNLIKLINAEKWGHCLQIERIDAWKYEGAGNLFIPVITLLKKLAGNEFNTNPEYWKKRALQVLKVTTLASVNIIGKKLFDIDTKVIEQYYNETDENPLLFKWEKLTDEIEETSCAFEELVQLALKSVGSHKLILCIDNLDRCAPENVVGLLESIKNFVGVENCVWVFAMDSGVVASYINRKYEGTTMDGNSYLDKIIPEQFHLSLNPSQEQDGKQIVELINNASGMGRIIEGIEELPQIPKVLVPRRLIKSARKLKEAENKAGIDPKIVFSLILLYHSWPEFYERLSSPSKEHIEAVLAHFFKDGMRKWEAVKPLPLDKKFTEDQELTYFLRKILPLYREEPDSVIQETTFVLEGLREVGLP